MLPDLGSVRGIFAGLQRRAVCKEWVSVSSQALPSIASQLRVQVPVGEITSYSFESFFHALEPTPSRGTVGGKINSNFFRDLWDTLCCCGGALVVLSPSLI